MDQEILETPKKKTDTAGPDADTVILMRTEPRRSSIQEVIDSLNKTYFFTYTRYKLKRKFLELLVGNTQVISENVLLTLKKYFSAADIKSIVNTERLPNNEVALQFAIKTSESKAIKILIEDFKIALNPAWIELARDDETKKYLEKKTPLYSAVEKRDVDAFKKALKKDKADITKHVDISIVDFIQSKIRENQDRNVVVRYFLNRKWNRMLRVTTGQIKKKLLVQSRRGQSLSPELLSLLNQCPPEEIYYALYWEGSGYGRLYNKFKGLDLHEYLNIFLQREQITSEDAPFREEAAVSRVPSNLNIVRQVRGPVPVPVPVPVIQDNPVEIVPQKPDVRTRFHGYLRENDTLEIKAMIRQQSLSKEVVQEVLNSQMDIDDDIKKDLMNYLERFEKPSDHPVKRALF